MSTTIAMNFARGHWTFWDTASRTHLAPIGGCVMNQVSFSTIVGPNGFSCLNTYKIIATGTLQLWWPWFPRRTAIGPGDPLPLLKGQPVQSAEWLLIDGRNAMVLHD